MKKAGLIILVFGLLITLFTGLNYVTQEVVMEAGDLSITKDQNHGLTWSPLVGIAVMILGGGIFITGIRKDNPAIKS